jgi:NADH-quinone oxidoreductase subunit F
MESLEGKKGQPRYKPPFPANFGLFGKPTTINNTETYASVPAIIRNGAEWFLNLGKPNNGGPKDLLGVRPCRTSGQLRDPPGHAVRRPAAAGRRHPRMASKLKAVIPGGFLDAGAAGRDHAGPDHGLRLDPEGRFRPGFGRGIVMDETTCMVRACQRIARFYFKESCGQCTPCREGTGWMYRMLTRIVEKQATA